MSSKRSSQTRTKYEYNDAGHLTKSIAPGNKTTTYVVNPAGEPTTVTGPLNHATTNVYDLAGRLTKSTDPLGKSSVAEYDLAGRQVAAKDLNNSGTVLRTATFGYDAAGNQTSVTSAEGHMTQQTFDAGGRLTSRIEPVTATTSITTTFGYDATGARTRLTDGRGNATWTTYNTLALPETVTEPATTAHPALADRTWTSLYDAAGNEVATIAPGGGRVDRTFDHLDRLTKQSGSGAEAATADRTFGYDLAGRATAVGDMSIAYNDRGLLTSVSLGGTQQTTWAYDVRGNPAQRVDAAGTATFTWDDADRLATATDPVTSRTLTYGYDNADRLKMITATGQASTQSFDYDAMDRPTAHTLKNGANTQIAKIAYGWDKDDNLTSKTTTGTAGAGANTYGYDRSGRLTSWTALGGATTAYEWDAAGNRTKAGAITFAFDERNRLTSGGGTDYTYTPRGTLAARAQNGTTTQMSFDAFDQLITDGDIAYGYDDLGRLLSRNQAGTVQGFQYSGLTNDIAAVTGGGSTVQAKYSRDTTGGLLGLQEGTGPALAALSDLHGDLVATFTATALTDSAAYNPFGEITAQTGTPRKLGYQGGYTDPDTGKVNMHARWYQPGTATFASRDTATLTPAPSVQANRYTYANASPLTGADPTGHATSGIGYYTPTEDRFSGIGFAPDAGPSYSGHGQTCAGTRCLGGGSGHICNAGICAETNEFSSWWSAHVNSPGFDYERGLLSDEEVERLGYEYMPNGRRVDQPNFWDASAKVQNKYMQQWSPQLTNEQLAITWVSVGGLESFNPKNIKSGGKAPSYTNTKIGKSSKIEWPYHGKYLVLYKYKKNIEEAATQHGIDKNALAALLIYEINRFNFEPKTGWGAALFASWFGKDPKKGFGMSQVETYRVRKLLKKYYPEMYADMEKKSKSGHKDLAELAANPVWGIHLAAARMRWVKENYRLNGHRLTDWQATIAYCGCAGKNSAEFQKRWNSGFKNHPDARLRYDAMYDPQGKQFWPKKEPWAKDAAKEYWRCVAVKCAE
ncbi:hypothetical protein C1I98_16990 [Spongiactinospora gelatinilytica]|uniref:Teneurin-like YD-shell domain-containing protein n=1 Tax=Spongiactinospora gelatinilytica TaxID=2666298 RepID=A0A2W2G902_9ACTN|nr:RHS repeat-associated core domain-containing protein [Spongiactinospora gelatinilytica]PZG44533.1 hypothetical protein C1I98_16990 [Spongiactinospora gelatinilytica]